MNQPFIPIIDLFAGPGGLGEGFVNTETGTIPFKVRLSIEKDPWAAVTLTLRKFYHELRQSHNGRLPSKWLDIMSYPESNPLPYAKELYPEEMARAEEAVWEAELGVEGSAPKKRISERIKQAVGGSAAWVLVGGPPCQAYSLVGRARMRNTEDFSEDPRHRLYRHYLEIIAEHEPPVFVMENVKGILSSPLEGGTAIKKILGELAAPGVTLGMKGKNARYQIHSLVSDAAPEDDPRELIIHAERYGIPQRRHRVILLGIREDIRKKVKPGHLTPAEKETSVSDVLRDLPAIRSTLSKEPDSWESWRKHVTNYASELGVDIDLSNLTLNPGNEKIFYHGSPDFMSKWYRRDSGDLLVNHAARGHMTKDLARYLYASGYAREHGKSPNLKNFSDDLLPDHKNAKSAKNGDGPFGDRFRVVMAKRPGPTVTCHISKDGHAFIHPDPQQCRSLTVREAARIQTFPDSYRFCGPRTEQYRQVGNAVPPLLARQIGTVVADILKKAELV